MPRFFTEIFDYNPNNFKEVFNELVILFEQRKPCVKQIYLIKIPDNCKTIRLYFAEICNALHWIQENGMMEFGCLFKRDVEVANCNPEAMHLYKLCKVFRKEEEEC